MGDISIKDNIKAVYNEKVHSIIKLFTEGKSLEEVAKDMNYTNPKSMDIYMRRRNFHFVKARGNYEPVKVEREGTTLELPSSSRVFRAIQLLGKEGADPKATAKRLGFKDHIDLANFMKSRGYLYDMEIANYTKKKGEVSSEDNDTLKKDDNLDVHNSICDDALLAIKQDPSNMKEIFNSEHAMEYLNLLEMLRKNKEKLIGILVPEIENGKIPRFVVGGTFVTKSVHMSNLLDELVREFSNDKNISQKEVFEVALIEFFRKYGYESAVETMFSR